MTQKEFYRTRAWVRTSRAFMRSKDYICERCGAPAAIVHHKVYLDDVKANNPSISLSWSNLEALCQGCHNQEHFGGEACAPGLAFDDQGNLVQKGGGEDGKKKEF